MRKSGLSLYRVEPLAVLFWALGILLSNTWPCPPAQHHSTAEHKACPYMVIVGSILNEGSLPPPLFLSRYYLSMVLNDLFLPYFLRFFLNFQLRQNLDPDQLGVKGPRATCLINGLRRTEPIRALMGPHCSIARPVQLTDSSRWNPLKLSWVPIILPWHAQLITDSSKQNPSKL